jgi:hypothetical protein
MFLFDEHAQAIVRQLALPPGVTSPHGLAWDGHSLWLSDVGEDPAVYELSPDDGSVRLRVEGLLTEGLAADADGVWGGSGAQLFHVDGDGVVSPPVSIGWSSVIQDFALADGRLFFVVNGGPDLIFELDRTSGTSRELTRDVHVAPYSLGFDGTYLASANEGAIRRYDPRTGATVGERPFAVPGWITAIAFVR